MMQQINALHVKHNTEKESMKKSIYLYRSELTAIGILLLVVVYILYKRKRKRKQPETKRDTFAQIGYLCPIPFNKS